MGFVVTEEMINAANDYVPVSEKAAIAEEIAEKCFDKLNVTVGGNVLPPMYKESSMLKNRYLMGAFVKLYLGIDFESEETDRLLMSASDYDKYAGAHIFNQMERMKSKAALRDKCFDIMGDYKILEKTVNTEVYAMLNAMNDFLGRAVLHIGTMATPEAVQEALSQLGSIKEELAEYGKETLPESTEA